MKQTLRDRLIARINKMQERSDVLKKYMLEYKKDENFHSALSCQYKIDIFDMIIQDLTKILD